MTKLEDPPNDERQDGDDRTAVGAAAPTRGRQGMFDLLAAMRARLAEDPSGIDYNHLTLSERQAALALVEADEARFHNIKGRTRVLRKTSNWPVRFLSMGGRS